MQQRKSSIILGTREPQATSLQESLVNNYERQESSTENSRWQVEKEQDYSFTSM